LEFPIPAQFFLLIITIGAHYTFSPIFWAWLMHDINSHGGTFVAAATGFVGAFGTIAQIISPFITTYILDTLGSYMWVTTINAIIGVVGIIFAIILLLVSRKFNRQSYIDDQYTKMKKRSVEFIA